MKNPKRMLAIAGMSLTAAALFGISAPAQAEPAAKSADIAASSQTQGYGWDDDYVVGYYNSEWQCNKAGWWGKKSHAWSDWYCYPAFVPTYGWVWVLEVEEDHWYWDNWTGGWPGNWPYKPTYMVHHKYHIGGPYKHPFKYQKGIKYGNIKGFPNDFPKWKKPGFPGYPGGGNGPSYPGGGNGPSYPGGGSGPSYPGGGSGPSYPGGGESPSYPGGGESPSYPGSGNGSKYPGGGKLPKLLGGLKAAGGSGGTSGPSDVAAPAGPSAPTAPSGPALR